MYQLKVRGASLPGTFLQKQTTMKNSTIALVFAGMTLAAACNSTSKPANTEVAATTVEAPVAFAEKHFDLDGPVNFRALDNLPLVDGKKVKAGLVFRSDKLSELSEADLSKMGDLNIQHVVDFRSQGEVDAEPDALSGTSMNYHHLPIGGDHNVSEMFKALVGMKDPADAQKLMATFYATIPTTFSAQYKAFFQLLLENENTGVVFHCTAGKDRTGIASALFLHTLGADSATIYNDYLLSNEYRIAPKPEMIEQFVKYGIDPEIGKALSGVHESFLAATFSTIEKNYGSVDNYLAQELGVDAAAVEKLKLMYTE